MKTIQTLISTTGRINGRGSDKFRWVSFLTASERQAVRDGHIVLIADDCDRSRAEYKRVTTHGGKFCHRNATSEEVATINSETC